MIFGGNYLIDMCRLMISFDGISEAAWCSSLIIKFALNLLNLRIQFKSGPCLLTTSLDVKFLFLKVFLLTLKGGSPSCDGM